MKNVCGKVGTWGESVATMWIAEWSLGIVLVLDQVADREDEQHFFVAAAGGGVNDDGGLFGRIGGGEGTVFYGTEIEPGFGGRAEVERADEFTAIEFAMGRVRHAVAGVIADDFVEPHLNATGISQMARHAARFPQCFCEGWKHEAGEDGDNRHHAKKLDQAKADQASASDSLTPTHSGVGLGRGGSVTPKVGQAVWELIWGMNRGCRLRRKRNEELMSGLIPPLANETMRLGGRCGGDGREFAGSQ